MSEPVAVYIVDDDEHGSLSLAAMLQLRGYQVKVFRTGEEWLAFEPRLVRSILILDLDLGAGIGGLQVLEQMAARDVQPPTIIISAYGDIPTAVRAMHLGAATFLEKPFGQQALVDEIEKSLLGIEDKVKMMAEVCETERLLKLLGSRERLILRLVCEGLPTKSIASQLELGMRTIESSRSLVVKHFDVGTWQEVIGRVNRFLGHRLLPVSAIYPQFTSRAGQHHEAAPNELAG
ncbi:MAG: response regulator [Planctomycetales bacterium]|nr:response regulator [Planctomycetales bacterium]